MIWEELSRIALIGTERAGLSAETRAALAKLGIDLEAGEARALLEGAALYRLLRQAGFPLRRLERQPAPAPESAALKPPSARAAQHLRLILSGRFPHALPEYLDLQRQRQQGLPPESLPPLFRLALRYPELWEQLRPCLGPAGHWLLRQNPEWQALAENGELENWPDAAMAEKQAMLRHLRRTQPELAAPLLQTVWEEAHYADQQAFLRAMAIGLGEHDESFLESCLNARRKEVRTAAAGLLCRLPGSALSQRLFAQAQALLEQDAKGSLRLARPRALSDALKRDGIGQGSAKHPAGQEAGWAAEMLSKIPPQRWEAQFGLPALETLRLLAASKDKELLVGAFANAALLHQDSRWMEAILRYWARTDDEQAWKSAAGKLLVRQLPAPLFNELALQQLRQQQGPVQERSLLFLLLAQGPQPWEDRLGLPLLQGFQEWMSAARSSHWNLWHYKRILQAASYRLSPRLLERLRAAWPAHSPAWHHWEKDAERFLRTLAFRQEMRERQ